MARYERTFMGIPAESSRPAGFDPNYGERYLGMRMRGGDGRAAYGAHRLVRRDDLGGRGGFYGTHGHHHPRSVRPFDPDWERIGGVRDSFREQELIRDFNANSPAFEPRGRRESDSRSMDHPSARRWNVRNGMEPDYGNRGVVEAGYGERWAQWPIRGDR